MEPRSSTLHRIDDAIKAIERARCGVLDEVALLGAELDELRRHCEHWHGVAIGHEREAERWKVRAIEAEGQIVKVIADAAAAVETAKNPRR